ncbi:hypothetical protein [Bradyrhizobium sp. Leo121]|uniref:hypothetical protein n=1 Tax=Bradyrhizobium sp. Leo121 TaxID=1571195 RepID=UPI0010299566|nr:hypothetical protein [Bradyrhizobium sp. Leo121]RZN35965.1 hypothetical protein CWO90_01895 [Bradyrhizobium sp. Leo121]
MSDEGEPIWRSDIDSLAFRPSGHMGICVMHRRAFRTLLGCMPSSQQCIDFYLIHRDSFEAAARAKLAARSIRETDNFHLTSRDVRRRLKNSVASDDAVG